MTIAGVNNGFPSEIFSDVGTGAIGNGGNITISSGSLSLSDGGRLNASTSGQGEAGNVLVQAKDSVSLAGSNTTIFSNVEAGGVGKGGDINISAASLSLTDGAQLQTLVRAASDTLPAGRGNAGNINIDVTGNVTISGVNNGFASEIFSDVETGAMGNGGNITISSGSLSLSNAGRLDASTSGQGNAGNIILNARDTITFDGQNSDNNYSRAITNVQSGGVGNAGNIEVTTGTLSLTNGAFLSSSVLGRGTGGNITIDARDQVNLDGIVGTSISSVQSELFTGGVGKGGNIQITTGSLSVTNGAEINTNTDGQGNGGNVTLNARDTITFDGFGNKNLLSSSANSTLGSNGIGNAGNISVSARRLFLTNGGELNANNFGQGNAGNITINTGDTVVIDGVGINGLSSGVSALGIGNAGNIQITTGTLSLTNGGELSNTSSANAALLILRTSETMGVWMLTLVVRFLVEILPESLIPALSKIASLSYPRI